MEDKAKARPALRHAPQRPGGSGPATRIPGADDDIGLAAKHGPGNRRDVSRVVLAIAVDADDRAVPERGGAPQPGAHGRAQADALQQPQALDAVGRQHRRRVVHRAIVDDQQIRRRA